MKEGAIAVSPKTRRTQEERSAATRERLLNAAIECLIEHGYHKTTTTEIALRAGVSRGAQLHHFPTKAELLTSAVEHLAKRRAAEVRQQVKSGPGEAGTLAQLTEVLWAAYSGPSFEASAELWLAARTDAELHGTVFAVERELGKKLYDLGRDLYGAFTSRPNFDDVLRMTIYMMRGMALERFLKRDDRKRRQSLRFWEKIMKDLLEA